MTVHSVRLVYFSPTHTTRAVLEAIAEGIGVDPVDKVDLTPPGSSIPFAREKPGCVTIIGAPVYGGRIPPEAVRRLRRFKTEGSPAVLVVLYGNREYEDALRELRDITMGLGFTPVAGASFIGEHSFHTEAKPIAAGRPDALDLQEARRFGQNVRAKLTSPGTMAQVSAFAVPGETPYREHKLPSEIAPATASALCTLCQACSVACSTAAIAVSDTVMTDQSACILCSACVKACPNKARTWEAEWVQRVATWLSTNCRERKEPELFL